MSYYVYVMANRRNGTLYVGVTNDIARRTDEHRTGKADSFTRRYGVKRLVYYEPHDQIEAAIRREKTLKKWPRRWKLRVIENMNPGWADLYETLDE